jgi:Ca2+-binding RTX toxin-like protein
MGIRTMATITGTDASDALNGTALADQIFGLGGNDTLVGFGGDDMLEGGAGGDELFGSNGFDTASYAGSRAGVTVVLSGFLATGGDAAGDHLYSIEGLRGSAYADVLTGDEGRNVLSGGGGADSLNGAEGDDTLAGGDGNDRLFGGRGADELRGGDGADLAYYGVSDAGVTVDLATGQGLGGDAEGDRLTGVVNVEGSVLGDHLSGDAAGNRLLGGDGNDVIAGGSGNDVVAGGRGVNDLDGGAGVDTLDYGQAVSGIVADLVAGRVGTGDFPGDTITGFERVIGSAFGDRLLGDDGANGLIGGAGTDLLQGGLGRDELTGGTGADQFRFSFTTESGVTAATCDVIHDFKHGEGDHLDFSQMDASTSRAGDQDPTFIGQKAFTAEGQVRFFFENDHTVVEVNTTGNSGAEMQIQLDGRVQLAAADFFFID